MMNTQIKVRYNSSVTTADKKCFDGLLNLTLRLHLQGGFKNLQFHQIYVQNGARFHSEPPFHPRVSNSTQLIHCFNKLYCPHSYAGFCPQYKYRMGDTYGTTTHKLLLDPTVNHAEKLVLSDRTADDYQVFDLGCRKNGRFYFSASFRCTDHHKEI